MSDLLRVCDSNINITVKTITFGLCHSKPKCDAIVINFIIFLAKYFIFQNKQNKKVPNIHVLSTTCLLEAIYTYICILLPAV